MPLSRGRPSFAARFARHRGGVVGAFIVLAFIAFGLLGPLVLTDPFAADVRARFQPPSAAHLLGTDYIGRDMLSRLASGAAISMRVAAAVVVMGLLFGVPIGAVSAFAGGLADLLVQRIIETIEAFPGILLLILIVSLAGPSLELAVVGLGLLAAPSYARLIRASVLQVREFAFVEAARATGCRDRRVLIRPNAWTPVIVHTSLRASTALILLAGMSFLDLGARPPTPEWGVMLAEGRTYLRAAPHMVISPSIAISLVVLGVNLVGDALRDALDPRTVYGRTPGASG